jgi:hypothetical protein
MKTSISTASYKIVIGNSPNCVTVPLSKFSFILVAMYILLQCKCKEGYDDILIHAAKTHLKLLIMDSEQ